MCGYDDIETNDNHFNLSDLISKILAKRNIRYFSFQHYKQAAHISRQCIFFNIYLKVCILNNVQLDLIMLILPIYKTYTKIIQFFYFYYKFPLNLFARYLKEFSLFY